MVQRRPRGNVLACLVVGLAGFAARGGDDPRPASSAPSAVSAVSAVSVSGRLTILDRGDRAAEDVGDAVVWLEGPGLPAAAPVQAQMANEDKAFTPHVLVVPVGSTITFGNHDPFDHNVFSPTEGNAFDLGLYDRDETRAARFPAPGVVRVYCNVHATMGAFVVVRDSRAWAMPAGDGSFTLADVPPGDYTLHAWHERATEVVQRVTVGPGGARDVALQLDARGWRPAPHLNKFGKPYPAPGRRY
jgi:plastocyanin